MAPRLPRAIQAQVDAADQVLTSINTPAAPEPNPEQTPPTSAAPAPEPAPAPAEPPAPEPAPPPAPSKEDTPEYWKARFQSVQGILNTQMPKLQQGNAQLQSEVQALKAKLEELSKAPAAPAPAPAPSQDSTRDVNDFGQDLVDMVKRQVSAYIAPMAARFELSMQDFDKRLKAAEAAGTKAAEKATMTAEEVFYQQLTVAVSDWEEINSAPEFLEWLGAADPLYRIPRQVALDKAHEKLDVQGAAAVFNAFKSLIPAAPAPSPMADVRAKQIEPQGNGNGQVVPAAQPKLVKAEEITRFYDEVAKGKWRGRDQERAEREQFYNTALAEGRIA
jgi:hypothetical protein